MSPAPRHEAVPRPSLAPLIASVGLGGSALQFPTEPLDRPDWDELMVVVGAHRLAGLLAEAVQKGLMPAADDQRAEVLDLHASAMEMCLFLEADLLTTSATLDAADVEHRVLKGPASAHLDYPDPARRVFGDIDLLVRSSQFDDAIQALSAAGHRRRFREVRPGFDRRFGKGVCLDGPTDHETDIHRTFVMGPYGLSIDLPELWSSASSFGLAGRPFLALDADHRFLHACYHAALGRRTPGIVPLRDLAGMLQRTHDPVDVARVRDIARRWRAEAVVARAVGLAWQEFALQETELSRWAAGYSVDRVDQRSLRAYLDPRMGYAAREFAALSAIPRLRDKAAFAWALMVPDRAFGAGRHGGRWRRWRDAARQIAALLRSGPRD